MKPLYKLALPLLTSTLMLTGCGGSGSDKVDNAINDVNDAYKDIEASVRDAYKKVEAKLSDDEKSMAEILEGIFLPEESLDHFLDKITPEGGKGGLYVGYFIEDNDNDSSDADIGGVYFDIGEDFAESVYGQMTYQQKSCQNLNTLNTETISVKTDELIGGVLSGSLDAAAIFDKDVLNHLRFDELKTTVSGMPFNGKYQNSGDTWTGQYTYEVGIDFGQKLSSNIDGCAVQYTLANQGDFHVYPLDYQLGNLNPQLSGTGSATQLTWLVPANTAYTLVSQINIDKAINRDRGYVRTNLLKSDNQFTPVIESTTANYAFVVQTFDANNKLTGYQAIIKPL